LAVQPDWGSTQGRGFPKSPIGSPTKARGFHLWPPGARAVHILGLFAQRVGAEKNPRICSPGLKGPELWDWAIPPWAGSFPKDSTGGFLPGRIEGIPPGSLGVPWGGQPKLGLRAKGPHFGAKLVWRAQFFRGNLEPLGNLCGSWITPGRNSWVNFRNKGVPFPSKGRMDCFGILPWGTRGLDSTSWQGAPRVYTKEVGWVTLNPGLPRCGAPGGTPGVLNLPREKARGNTGCGANTEFFRNITRRWNLAPGVFSQEEKLKGALGFLSTAKGALCKHPVRPKKGDGGPQWGKPGLYPPHGVGIRRMS